MCTLYEDKYTFISCSFLLRMRNVPDKEKIKTNILHSITISKNRTVYETMWKLTVQPDRPQMIIWDMHIAYSISKATNTHSECEIIIDFPLQQWWHKCTSVLCYMYFVHLLVSFEVNSLDLRFTGFHSIFTDCLPKVRQKLKHVRCTIHIGTEPTLI
jgi:hypothetical protein